jgi:hypothetical protein
MSMRKFAWLAGCALLLGACTMEIKPTVTPLAYVPDRMELVGKVYGEAKWGRFLYIIPGGEDEQYSTYKATERALQDSPGRADAILNPTVDVQTQSFLGGLWEEQTVRVSGEGIRFKNPEDASPASGSGQTLSPEELKKLAARIKAKLSEEKQ